MSIAERALMLHRQRRKRTQQKYRKRLKNKEFALEDSVNQLREEILELKKNRACWQPLRDLSETTSWNVVIEYVRLFRHGYKPPTLVTKPDGTTTPLSLDANYTQKRFLQAAMMPDVAFNNGYGVVAVFEDWKFISQHHENTETQLVSLEYGAGGVMVAYMKKFTTITANMARNSLLNLVTEEEAKWPILARKLLGQTLVIPTTVRYEWDDANARFISIYYQPDRLTPLLKLLANLEDVNTVFCSALGNHCRR